LISADGFYEWARAGSKKQPYFFRLRGEQPFCFAGLWGRWQGGDGAVIESCTILTTEANDVLRPVHDWMSVIIHPEDSELWLDDNERKTELRQELLQPFPAKEMLSHPVSTLVNSTRNQGADLVAQVPINSL
jgi:putative SOS response-associated peptidase YedK